MNLQGQPFAKKKQEGRFHLFGQLGMRKGLLLLHLKARKLVLQFVFPVVFSGARLCGWLCFLQRLPLCFLSGALCFFQSRLLAIEPEVQLEHLLLDFVLRIEHQSLGIVSRIKTRCSSFQLCFLARIVLARSLGCVHQLAFSHIQAIQHEGSRAKGVLSLFSKHCHSVNRGKLLRRKRHN